MQGREAARHSVEYHDTLLEKIRVRIVGAKENPQIQKVFGTGAMKVRKNCVAARLWALTDDVDSGREKTKVHGGVPSGNGTCRHRHALSGIFKLGRSSSLQKIDSLRE